jgi:hypothetical protein
MQLMSWMVARLGSRFSLLFEPYQRRVKHSALGRWLDQPLDLMVGLIEPDGTQRVLPFTTDPQAVDLLNAEQFDRFNSITFRGFSENYRLRFEFNVHSVFYPHDERLCVMPAVYLEMRVNPVDRVRWTEPKGPTPEKVKLFIRLRRPGTQITAASDGEKQAARIDLTYQNSLTPHGERDAEQPSAAPERFVTARERIVSLNPDCQAMDSGDGLICELPVTEAGSGIKWRLIWAAHVAEPVLQIKQGEKLHDARLRYCTAWKDLDAVIAEAIETRDDRLAYSRRFEKLLEQVPLDMAQRHLLDQTFQNWLSNTFWCDVLQDQGPPTQWFSVCEGKRHLHSAIDVEYNASLLYLTLWPQLLALQLQQWSQQEQLHEPSGGSYLGHDLGQGSIVAGPAYPYYMEVESTADYLLLLQTYTHWTGDSAIAKQHTQLITRLAQYLLWSDRDSSGFPSEGVANTITDGLPAVRLSRKQTYLAVKRLTALRAAAGLLGLAKEKDLAQRCEKVVETDPRKIERAAWLGDHYAVCVDTSAVGVIDPATGKALPYEQIPGWDAYSIYTANGLLLPMLIGQPDLLEVERLKKDISAATRECLGRYGCGHTSAEPDSAWISQNLWRDVVARYMKLHGPSSAQLYWDMQVMSNTDTQSLGFADSYITNELYFYPRGVVSIGYLLAGPRLMIDRLAAGGAYITVDPDRQGPLRWPLLPLADWKAGKIPVCVVDDKGNVTIEAKIDPVIIHGTESDAIGSADLIG